MPLSFDAVSRRRSADRLAAPARPTSVLVRAVRRCKPVFLLCLAGSSLLTTFIFPPPALPPNTRRSGVGLGLSGRQESDTEPSGIGGGCGEPSTLRSSLDVPGVVSGVLTYFEALLLPWCGSTPLGLCVVRREA